jgi:hypothetical protein
MFALISFYIPIRKDIAKFNPVLQFFSIKFVILFQIWLSVVIKMFSHHGILEESTVYLILDEYWTSQEASLLLQAFITNIEMVIASLIHIYAFDCNQFITPDIAPMKPIDAFKDSFSAMDILADLKWLCAYLYLNVRKMFKSTQPEETGLLQDMSPTSPTAPVLGTSRGSSER